MAEAELPYTGYCRLRGQLLLSVADTNVDVDKYPDGIFASGTILLTPSLTGGFQKFAVAGVGVVPKPIVLVLDATGTITVNGSTEVYIPPTNDPASVPVGWTWTATFLVAGPDGVQLNIPSYSFQAPVGGDINLFAVAPVAAGGGTLTVRGPAGIDGTSDEAMALVAVDPTSKFSSLQRIGYVTPTGVMARRDQPMPAVSANPPIVSKGGEFSDTTISSPQKILPTDARLRVSGGTLTDNFTGSNSIHYYEVRPTPTGAGVMRIEFSTDAPRIDIPCARTGGLLITVDGEHHADGYVTTTVAGSTQFHAQIDFTTSRPRHVVIQTNHTCGGVVIPPTYQLWKPTKPRPVKCAMLTDSIGQGDNPVTLSGGPYVLAAQMLGWDHTVVSGVGGTGWLNNNTSYTTFRQRLAELTDVNPDVAGFFGGINDQSRQSKATLQAEILTTLQQTRTALPNALLWVSGPWSASSPTNVSSNYIDVRDAHLGALASIEGPWIFIDPLTGGWRRDDGATGAATTPWITGTGTIETPVGDGNADRFMHVANIPHPTAPGNYYAAHRLMAATAEALSYGA